MNSKRIISTLFTIKQPSQGLFHSRRRGGGALSSESNPPDTSSVNGSPIPPAGREPMLRNLLAQSTQERNEAGRDPTRAKQRLPTLKGRQERVQVVALEISERPDPGEGARCPAGRGRRHLSLGGSAAPGPGATSGGVAATARPGPTRGLGGVSLRRPRTCAARRGRGPFRGAASRALCPAAPTGGARYLRPSPQRRVGGAQSGAAEPPPPPHGRRRRPRDPGPPSAHSPGLPGRRRLGPPRPPSAPPDSRGSQGGRPGRWDWAGSGGAGGSRRRGARGGPPSRRRH